MRTLSHKRAKGKTLVLAIVLAMPLAVASVPPAQASLSPCGSFGNWQAGGVSARSVAIFGAQANLSLYAPDLCDGTTDSTAWVMVNAYSSVHSGGVGWAQSGYGRFGVNEGYREHGVLEWAEYVKWWDPGTGQTSDLTDKFGGSPCANCLYSSFAKQDGRIHMYADQVQIAETDFTYSSVWQAAWRDDFSSETFYKQSDIPGGPNNHVEFRNIQKAISNSSDWDGVSRFDVDVSPAYCRYHAQHAGSTGAAFDVWTAPLTSGC